MSSPARVKSVKNYRVLGKSLARPSLVVPRSNRWYNEDKEKEEKTFKYRLDAESHANFVFRLLKDPGSRPVSLRE